MSRFHHDSKKNAVDPNVYVPRTSFTLDVGEIFNRLMDIKRLEKSGKGPETVRPVPLLERKKIQRGRKKMS